MPTLPKILDLDVLACMTDKSPCCSSESNRFGDLTYNNGVEVVTIGTRANSGIDYFRNRDDFKKIYLSLRSTQFLHSSQMILATVYYFY